VNLDIEAEIERIISSEPVDKAIKSLEDKSKKETNEKNQIKILFTIANLYKKHGNFNLAIHSVKKILDLSRKNNLIEFEISSYLTIAELYAYLGKLEITIQNLEMAEILLERDKNKINDRKEKQAILLKIRGNLALDRKEHEEARKYYEKSLKLFKKLEKHVYEAELLSNMGILFQSKGEYKKALKNYEKSKDIYLKLDNARGIGACENNIGEIFRILGRYNEAISHYKETLKIGEETGNKQLVCYSLHNLGMVAHLQGELKQAEEFYKTSLVHCEEIGNFWDIAETTFFLARLYLKLDKLENIEELMQKLKDLQSKTQNISIKHVYKILKALTLFNSDNRIKRAEAVHILNTINKEEIPRDTLTIFVLLILLLFYIEELYAFKDKEIFSELEDIYQQLEFIVKESNMYHLLVQIYHINAIINFIKGEDEFAKEILEKAVATAEKKELKNLKKYVKDQYENLTNLTSSEDWNDAFYIKRRIELTAVDELLKKIIEEYYY